VFSLEKDFTTRVNSNISGLTLATSGALRKLTGQVTWSCQSKILVKSTEDRAAGLNIGEKGSTSALYCDFVSGF